MEHDDMDEDGDLRWIGIALAISMGLWTLALGVAYAVFRMIGN